MKKNIIAMSTLVGTIIGVGLFGLPFVAMKSGFLVTFVWFAIIAAILILLQLMYAEVSLQKPNERHQLPGYTESFLGKRFKHAVMIAQMLSVYGAALAYILIGGEFFFQLLSPWLGGTVIIYQIIFFLSGSLLIYQGLKSVATTEFLMLLLMLGMILFLFLISIDKIEIAHFQTVNFKHAFFPYGIIIFSLWGVNLIPSIKDYLEGDIRHLKKIISWSVVFCSIAYLLFIITVLGVSGEATSADALTGLVPFLSSNILFLGFLFGVLTTFTSYIALGMVLKDSFIQDYHLSHELSWFLTVFVPLALFGLGIKNFLAVLNITGAIMLASQGIVIALLYLALLRVPKYAKKVHIKIPRMLVYLVAVILTLGILSEVLTSVR